MRSFQADSLQKNCISIKVVKAKKITLLIVLLCFEKLHI